MLTIGEKFPNFSLIGTVSNDITQSFIEFNNQSFTDKWLVIFFWPKDFTFVCPTEIAEFARLHGEFTERNTQILGASIDSEFVHLAWRKHHPDLRQLPFPMLSDIKHELIQALGIVDPNEGVAQRATFIVDPEGMIRFSMVTDSAVGRNPSEVLRVLEALQTNALCPCNWQPGEATLTVN